MRSSYDEDNEDARYCDGYDDYDPELDCEHDDYDIDVCTGRASCNCCSKEWYVSTEEVNRELDRQARYYEDMEREERWRWLRDLWRPIRFAFAWRPWAKSEPPANDTDDDIPF